MLTVPLLEGEQVRLRPFADTDANSVVEAGLDPTIPQNTTVVAHGDHNDALAFIQRQHQRAITGEGWSFAITNPETDTAVGHIGLWRRNIDHGRASIGYWILQCHRRHGYATRALCALSSWAATHDDISRLELFVEPMNEGSWRAAESAGYQREGLLRRWQKVDGQPRDMYIYARLP
ncbi:RimJ/RimL family protein N-acetyltransferase [Nocardia mexicana]|uniref:RimJ/RimL family protein N-acetyltransferase n=2 Tax=Nocardia mexicana TaxID=279262 RepID=A0A370HAI2_9NOCA|nr:RimJ/RimL family protein N-acetyltransferase [Nocardia mexicana]